MLYGRRRAAAPRRKYAQFGAGEEPAGRVEPSPEDGVRLSVRPSLSASSDSYNEEHRGPPESPTEPRSPPAAEGNGLLHPDGVARSGATSGAFSVSRMAAAVATTVERRRARNERNARATAPRRARRADELGGALADDEGGDDEL